MKKGIFIVLDGNDGSGKATQSKLLADALEAAGRPSERMDFPGYDRNLFGALIGECLAGAHGDFLTLDPKIASSLYALDRLESASHIRELLESGTTVIADRFASSNQIHQGGKIADDPERAAFLEWLDRMEHEVLRIPRPDAIIYLRVPVETSLGLLSEKRAQKNAALGEASKDMVEEDRAYLERSHETANWLLERQPNWQAIECMENGRIRSIESIHEEVWAAVSRLLER
ncbi:MAG TPA: thymidylate kinase [Candidatus Paceibacterota bacterium]|nr:thymidylate kinase [Candidatus Paceibacterota bacterium]